LPAGALRETFDQPRPRTVPRARLLLFQTTDTRALGVFARGVRRGGRSRGLGHRPAGARVWYAVRTMRTEEAAHQQDEPDPRNLRLVLSAAEWRALRVWAAEEETSMQALVAKTMQREVAQHVRARATENALSIGRAGRRKGGA
jgi:hypothetical protein